MADKFRIEKDGRSVKIKDKSKKEDGSKPAEVKKTGGDKKKGER